MTATLTDGRFSVNKAKLNFWVDVAIGIAGVISAVSGLVFLLPADQTGEILGISLRMWSTLHTWSSLAAVAGVGLHLVLHWKWALAMTRQMLPARRGLRGSVPASELVAAEAGGSPISRRAFLALGGMAAVATGLVAAGYRVLADAASAEESQSSSLAAGTAQETGVACRFGLVNDPYPGRCRRYVDADGDGLCDYSVPGSGSYLAGNEGGGLEGGLSRGRGNWGRP
jgi:hypothetical protein